jgi:hypothetical protein
MYSLSLDMIVRTNNDGTRSYIPADPTNTDYQQYLEWLEEGNAPEEWNPEA